MSQISLCHPLRRTSPLLVILLLRFLSHAGISNRCFLHRYIRSCKIFRKEKARLEERKFFNTLDMRQLDLQLYRQLVKSSFYVLMGMTLVPTEADMQKMSHA
ncbi:uncharacterized protein [Arachis hypogaea]|uniref:uncharacterized protein isoform X2 n=1 Tax=Arachis hypogaea TaxID=3818 RepID=UPI003B21EC42